MTMVQLNPQDKERLDNFTGMSVGQIFRKAREDQGFYIGQIAAHLNIGSAHLEAIEADDKGSLPPQVYAVGFVRAYADVLGLDPEKMAYLFKIQSYGVKKTEEQKAITRQQGETISAGNALSQKLDSIQDNIASFVGLAIVGLLIVGVIGTLLWLVWPRDNSGDALSVPPAPVEILNEGNAIDPLLPADDEDVGIVEAQAQIPTEPIDLFVRPDEGKTAYGADSMESPLAFKAVDETWVEIRTVKTGETLLTRTLKQGDVFYASEGVDVFVTTGNAGGLEVYLDGKNLGVLGGKSEIIRLRPFSAQSLRLQNDG